MSFQLNPAQTQAVEHEEGSAIIIAGAGTGKTRVITQRILRLLEKGKCRPENILALTFTEKAAQEMQERLDLSLPLGYGEVKIRTFHAFCKEILTESGLEIGLDPGFKLLDDISAWIFLRENLSHFQLDYFQPLGNPTRFLHELRSHFSRLKEEDIAPEDYFAYAEKLDAEKMLQAKIAAWETEQNSKKRRVKKELPREEFAKEIALTIAKEKELARAYRIYENLLQKNNLTDFGGLIYLTLKLFRQRPNVLAEYQKLYQYILVDEFQDTNFAQNELVEMLAQKHQNLMVVGDDDQAIYKFRGASLSNILQFEQKHPDTRKFLLTQNYRSTQTILDLAYVSIQNNNPHRLEIKLGLEKKLQAANQATGNKIKLWQFPNDQSEAAQIAAEIRRLVGSWELGVGSGEQGVGSEGVRALNSFNEIAILVRSKNLAEVFLSEFDRQGIPYRFVGNRGLFLQPEIKILLNFLTVLARPDNTIALFGLMQSNFFHFPQLELIRYLHSAREEKTTLFNYLNKLYQADPQKNAANLNLFEEAKTEIKPAENPLVGFMALLHHFLEMSKTVSTGQLLWAFLKAIKIEAHLQNIAEEKGLTACQIYSGNLQEFFQKIADFEKNNDAKTVIHFYAYLEAQMEAGDNPKTAEAEEDTDAVKIMTIHQAKGLEFKTVFLPALAQNKFPAVNRRDAISIPEALIKELEISENFHLEEERRLFYVGLTRAQENLYLSSATNYNQGTAKWRRSLFLEEISASEFLATQEFVKDADALANFEAKFSVQKFKPNDAGNFKQLFSHPFSYTQFSTFQACPKKFHYRYLLRIPGEPSIGTNFGSSVHNALKDFYREMKKKQQIPPPDSFKLYLVKNWLKSGYHNPEEEADYQQKALRMLLDFYQTNQNNWIIPEQIEEKFSLRLKSADDSLIWIEGRIDRIDPLPDGTFEVIDYKTGQLSKNTAKELGENLQLSLYAIAARELMGLNATKFSLYFLKDNQKISTERSAEDLAQAKNEIETIFTEIKQGHFPATPDTTTCSFCDYRSICPEAVW